MGEQLQERFKIARWIAEEFSGVIPEKHKEMLEAWKEESAAHAEEYAEFQQEFRQGAWRAGNDRHKIGKAWNRFVFQRYRSRFNYRYASVAAVVLIVSLGALFCWQWRSSSLSGMESPICLAQDDVILTLAGGRKVPVGDSAAFAGMVDPSGISKTGHTLVYAGVSEEGTKEDEVYNTLSVPRGTDYQLVLADGTRVFLNAETSLVYPTRFCDRVRRVRLDGEAFFEVAGNPEKPFVVSTAGGVEIRVLGTRFNVSAYRDEENVITTLNQGSVEVSAPSGQFTLSPDEQLVFNKESVSFTQSKVDADIYSAWTGGKLVFEKMPLEGVMRLLQRYYDMEVFYLNDGVRHLEFSGELEKYASFGKILSMLEEVSGLDFKIRNNCITVGFR